MEILETKKEIFYKVILTKNGKYIKDVAKFKSKKGIKKVFDKYKESNKKVTFPITREFYRDKETDLIYYRPIQYKLLAIKTLEDGDKPRVVKDIYGRLVEEPIIIGEWLIVDDLNIYMEEKFKVFSFKQRKTYNELFEYVLSIVKGNLIYKQFVRYKNKIIIWNESDFDCISCKGVELAINLYERLKVDAIKSKIKGFIFVGEVIPNELNSLMSLILENTGWDEKHLYREYTFHRVIPTDDYLMGNYEKKPKKKNNVWFRKNMKNKKTP